MTTSRAGYWDLEACAWVGGEPMYVAPPVPHAPERSDLPADAVPAQRTDAEEPAAPAVDAPRG